MEMIFFLIIGLIFVIIPIIYYCTYKSDLKEFYNHEVIKGTIEKVELAPNFNNENEEYTLTIKLENGEIITTNIIRKKFSMGRYRKTWIPIQNEEINVYKSEDGTYKTNYPIKFKKSILAAVFSLLILGIVWLLCGIYAIININTRIITAGETILEYSTEEYNYDTKEENNIFYEIILNEKNQYVITYRKYDKDFTNTIERKEKKITKEDVDYIIKNNETISCTNRYESHINFDEETTEFTISGVYEYFNYYENGEKYCLEINDTTKNQFEKLLN